MRWRAPEAEGFGVGLHGGDAVGDVILKGDLEFGCAFDDVVAIDAAGEGFVLHFLFHSGDIDIVNGFGWFDERAGGKESRELIAGEERPGELRGARDAGVFGVAEDGGAHFFGPALFGEDGDADEGMLFGRGMFLVVEVVEECGGGPGFEKRIAIFAGETAGISVAHGVGADTGFNSERVFDEAGRLCVFIEKRPCAFAGIRRLGHRLDYPFRFFQAFAGEYAGDSQFLLDNKDTYQAMYLKGRFVVVY